LKIVIMTTILFMLFSSTSSGFSSNTIRSTALPKKSFFLDLFLASPINDKLESLGDKVFF